MPWNIPLFDSTGKIKDASLAGSVSVSGTPIIEVTTAVGFAQPPFERVGVLRTCTWKTTSFFKMGTDLDGMNIHTFDPPSDFKALNSGGTFNIDYDATRININSVLGFPAPESDFALRVRLRYDCDYTAALNAPRNKLFWYPGPNDFEDGWQTDTEFWVGYAVILPSDYELDDQFGRETLWQEHNSSQAPGMMHHNIDKGEWRIHTVLTDTSTTGGVERKHVDQNVTSDRGEITYWILNYRFNPFDTETTVNLGMGSLAQDGVTFEGNKGRLRIWKTIAPGETVESLDLGNVTNNGNVRAEFLVCDIQDAPLGRVPDWKDGVVGRGPIKTEFGIYKSGWFNDEPFATRPAIPHAKSTKEGPIDIYFASFRRGDANSNYQSVHPLQSVLPRSLRGQLTFETGAVQSNGNINAVNGLYTDGFFIQTTDENGAARVISNITNSTTPIATYSGAPLLEGDGVTLSSVEGMTELEGRLMRVRNPTSTTFDVYQDGDDTGYNPTTTTEGNTQTDTSSYGTFSGTCLAQPWQSLNTGAGNPNLPTDADVKVAQTSYTPPTNAISSANDVPPLVGSYFLSSEIFYWKDNSVITGNSNQNKPRFSCAIGGGQQFEYNEEEWFSFSIFLPSNYDHEATLEGTLSRNQLMYCNAPDESSTNNPVEIHLAGDGGEAFDHYMMDYIQGDIDSDIRDVDLGSTENDVDKWTTFIIRIKNHVTSGILEVWKSTGPYLVGKQRSMTRVFSRTSGGVGLNPSGSAGFEWNFRQYKFAWHHNANTIDSTVIWIGWDELRYGGENENTKFVDVHPFQHKEPLIQIPASPDLGATTYNTGRDLTFDEDGFPSDPIIRIGYDWSMPASATSAPRGGVFQSGSSWPSFWAGNRLQVLNLAWNDVEAVENTYDFSIITDAMTTAIAAGYAGCILQFRGNVTAIEDEFGDPTKPEQITAPTWMFGEATQQEGLHSSNVRITNLLISDTTVKQNWLDLIAAFGTAGIASDSRLFGAVLHGVSNSQGEEWTGSQAGTQAAIDAQKDIIDAWGSAYGSDSDKQAWMKENPIELHDQAVVINGMGLRGGSIENWWRNSYTPHVGGITSKETGQIYNATNGHLEWDEDCLPMSEQRHWMDENEHSTTYTTGPKPEYHYRGANLRMLQMRRNVAWLRTGMVLDPRMDNWMGLTLGHTASTTDSAFVWLQQSNAWISGGPKSINNMERWLCQFESEGTTTLTSRRDWDKNLNDDGRLTSGFWWTDTARMGESIGITVDPAFIPAAHRQSVAIRIVYEDTGTGSWTLNVDLGDGIGGGQGIVNLDDTDAIRTATFFFSDFQANGGTADKSFSLDDASGAVPFIFIEVIKI